jgi:hypothetical protein
MLYDDPDSIGGRGVSHGTFFPTFGFNTARGFTGASNPVVELAETVRES